MGIFIIHEGPRGVIKQTRGPDFGVFGGCLYSWVPFVPLSLLAGFSTTSPPIPDLKVSCDDGSSRKVRRPIHNASPGLQ